MPLLAGLSKTDVPPCILHIVAALLPPAFFLFWAAWRRPTRDTLCLAWLSFVLSALLPILVFKFQGMPCGSMEEALARDWDELWHGDRLNFLGYCVPLATISSVVTLILVMLAVISHPMRGPVHRVLDADPQPTSDAARKLD